MGERQPLLEWGIVITSFLWRGKKIKKQRRRLIMIRCDLRQVRVADRSDESGYVIKTYLVYYDRDEVGRWRVGGYLPHPVHTNESPKSYKSRLFTMKAIYKGSKLPLLEINLYGELVPFSWVSKTPTLPIYEDEDEDENEVDIDIEGEEE